MSDTKSDPESAASPPPSAGAPASVDPAFWSNLEAVTTHLARAADAQFAIWKMKLVRRIMLIAAAIAMMVAALALLIYGFTLLDKTFDFALQNAGIATWFSPLVRGCLYIVVPVIAAWRVSQREAA